MRSWPIIGAILFAFIAAGVGIAVVAQRNTIRVPAYLGTLVDPPKAAPDAVLLDQHGRAAHVIDPKYAATFLFFGYTHCPDECPLALASLARAYRAMPPEDAARMRIVFVSVDPERDTPAVMKRYVENFGIPMTGLTGSTAALAPVWKAYGVQVDTRSREIGHGDAIYGIDNTQRVVLVYTPDVAAAELRTDAELLVN